MSRCLLLLVLCVTTIFSSNAAGANQLESCEGLPRITLTTEQSSKECILKAKSSLLHSFNSIRVVINCSRCEILHGRTRDDIQNAQSTWSQITASVINMFSPKAVAKNNGTKINRFSPFLDRYIMVKGGPEKDIKMRIDSTLDVTCLALLLSGAILFYSAQSLSSSVKFYYTGGVGIGVLASLLIVVFILSRFVPKKPAAYTILLGGWSLGAWIMRMVWNNWQSLLLDYHVYFIAYVAVAGFLSFALCYWKGPVKDERSQHIIQWTIQIIGLFLLYNSSQSPLVSIGIISSIIIGNFLFLKPDSNFFRRIKSFIKIKFWRAKPRPPKLLTEEEYRIQGDVETRKALQELKEYCNSPQCSPWKTLSRIKSPEKFVSFMEGQAHVSDTEMTLHDTEILDTDSEDDANLITDDETETDELHKGDSNHTAVTKNMPVDSNISEDED